MMTPQCEQVSASETLSLIDNSLYINREIFFIQFNRRVLEEVTNPTHPLFTLVKYLSIFANNIDEFMMIRVSSILRQIRGGVLERHANGMTQTEQMQEILNTLIPLQIEASRYWRVRRSKPLLPEQKIFIHKYRDLGPEMQGVLQIYFKTQVFPILTPMTFDGSHPFPFISNLSTNLAVVIAHPTHGQVFSRVKVPNDQMSPSAKNPEYHYIVLEDLVTSNIQMLSLAMEVKDTYVFWITRDADMEIEKGRGV